jgi:hypothetical protein
VRKSKSEKAKKQKSHKVTRTTGEKARNSRALAQDLGKLATHYVEHARANGSVQHDDSEAFARVATPIIKGFAMDIEERLYHKGSVSHTMNFERVILEHLRMSGGKGVEVDLIRVFKVVWCVLFDEEFHGNTGGDEGLHEGALVLTRDYTYLEGVARNLPQTAGGQVDPSALTTRLISNAR